MTVHDSALKHGVRPEGSIRAAEPALWIEPLEDEGWPHRELRLGFDTPSRLLDTVVLMFRSGEEIVIHAMSARRQYWGLLP
ncbi:toxin [Pseudactinotalea sp. HY160]|uniref:toxin n=1 Tax=Pseudactinotalea sp. HY160 TaxID=2654490 RepID=UPI001312F608|nr:toxin [Pseudactinotalea sp. HY160]